MHLTLLLAISLVLAGAFTALAQDASNPSDEMGYANPMAQDESAAPAAEPVTGSAPANLEAAAPPPQVDSMKAMPERGAVADGTEAILPRMQGTEATYDLKSAVMRGLKLNPQITAAREQFIASGYGKNASLSAMGPKFTASYGYSRFNQPVTARYLLETGEFSSVTGSKNSFILSFNLTQPIFTGFRLLSTYQKSIIQEEQAELTLYNAELQLILAIQTNYLELLKGRMDVKNAEDSVARLESQLKVTRSFYDVGLRPRLDVLQAEVDLATARQQLLIAKNNVATQQARLNTLLDLPLENETAYVGELTYIPFDLTLNDCLDRAYKNRPDLKIGRKSVDIAMKDTKIAASGFYPQVSANWNYQQTGDKPSATGSRSQNTQYSSWSVGAQVDWTLFESGQTYFSYRQAKQTIAQIEAELADTRLNAGFEVKSNLLALQEAADRIGVARKSLTEAREGFRMAEARYQAQVGTNTDVLDAQERVSRSEAELSQALADYLTAMANLYTSMGEKNLDLAAR